MRSLVGGWGFAIVIAGAAAPVIAQDDPVVEDPVYFKEVKSLRKYYGPILGAWFLNQDNQIITCGKDKMVRLWDAATGKQIREMRGHTSWAVGVAMAPGEKAAVSVGIDGQVIIWDLATGTPTRIIRPSEDPNDMPMSVAWHPKESRIAVGMRLGTLLEYDPATGSLLSERRSAESLVFGVAYSPDGKMLASTSYEVVKIWDLEDSANDRELGKHEQAEVRGLAWSANSRYLVSGGTDGQTIIYDVRSGKIGRIFQGHDGPVISVAYDHEGGFVASGGADGLVYVWDVRGGKPKHKLEGHRVGVYAVQFSSNDSQLLTAALDSTLRLWRVEDGTPLANRQCHGGFINSVSFTQDDRHLAVGGVEYSVKMWEVRNFKPSVELKGKEWDDAITRMTFNPTHHGELAVGHEQGAIKTWLYPGKEVEASMIAHKEAVTGLAFVGRGRYLVSGGVDSKILVMDMKTRQVINTLGHVGAVSFIAAHPKEPVFASSDESGFIQIVGIKEKLDAWTVEVVSEAHEGGVLGLQFSPDGSTLASCGKDKKLKLWNAANGRPLQTYGGHAGDVTAVAYHPSGQYIATASKDKTVRIRRTSDGALIQILQGYTDEVWCLAFDSDGSMLATGSADGEVKFWAKQRRDD